VKYLAVIFDIPQIVIEQKGRAAHLLKGNSKKKRSFEELEEVKSEESELHANRQRYLKNVKQMKQNYVELEREVERHRHNEELLNQLHSEGVIDEAGNVLLLNHQ
jgi:predicted nuclease with TOPRIM domain